jgi:integrase
LLGPVLVLRFRSAQFVKRYIVSERKPQWVNSMNTRDRLEGCVFHTLRHTIASHLTMSGVDSFKVQDLGRWKTEKMVKRYAHLLPNYKKKAVNKLTFGTQDKHEISTPIKTKLKATP